MRVLKAGAALIALGALLGGVPWFLLTFADPAHLLQVNWATALTVGADSRVILALLALVGWLAWAVLALTITFEVLAVLSQQRIRLRLPGTGWLRPLVGTLVMTAVAAPSIAAADTAPPPLVDAIAQVSAEHTPTAAPAPADAAEPSGRPYVIQPGDELWAIAERELGSGERWRELVELNPGLGPETRLEAGGELLLPQPVAQAEATVVVEEGDTLWHIAGEALGDPTRWPEIQAANADQITDPDQIDVGWELRLPTAAEDTELPEAAELPEASELSGAGEHIELDEVAEVPEAESALELDDPATGQDAAAQAVAEAFGSGFPQAVEEQSFADTANPVENLADAADVAEASDADDYSGLLAPVGATLASAVLVGVGARRRAQLLARAVGRRLLPVPAHVARFWTALAHRAEAAEPTNAEATPTMVTLGWNHDEPVEVDLESERVLVFTGAEAPAAIGAAVTGLTCAPWSADVNVFLVGGPEWVDAMDDPRVMGAATTAEGLEQLTRMCSERRMALRQHSLAEMRADEDLADAFGPTVVVFFTPLSPAQLDEVTDALSLGHVGVSVLASITEPLHLPLTQIRVDGGQASLRGCSFTPQLVTAPARRALLELLTATGQTSTEPAPWWVTDDDLPPNVLPLPRQDRPEERPMTTLSSPSHPTLLLLGDLGITGAAGTAPTRATGQCMEYCAWLLQHPGSTPTLMLRDLQVADATRRSNMSRLRTWLGADEVGVPYLPDAYTGRVSLDERVTSDWEQFTALLSGGVTLASTTTLQDALALVRGEPLGTFAFQWHWAQQLHADMVSMIVDAACVLADRCLAQGDLTLALWAVHQGRMGAPFDDALSVREIEALRMAGRHSDVDHAVVRLNRMLRAEGRDLEPALAARVQEAMMRPRRAAEQPAPAGEQPAVTSR
ncbi:MAG: LysM peptidoglycan-binding domain-containing protein [Propionibacteriaceae bacterium]|nr:LysM peptidoglycan-binding domain-containing protein [Propionibacteriaceae bacterium]